MKKIIFGMNILLIAIAASGVVFADSHQKPNIVILATGGTIAGSAEMQTQAGYTSGQVGVEVLINAVPQIKDLANITGGTGFQRGQPGHDRRHLAQAGQAVK